ncbi:hypothetical protein NXX87_25770 [Bacteroides faecis]|uniref:hypothetical protein n=1 Tax=Bacteroides faecis TaxID=674529 RepID=UPI00216492DC|nr:hypothetical protein [Bacteroides faecis]UVS34067.1 hypothetical protein NXX87_25770 [Bacteroides faecis]
MNFYLIGSLEGFNDLRFPNVEDWQNCMGHAEGLLKQWNPPEMEYIWKKVVKTEQTVTAKTAMLLQF